LLVGELTPQHGAIKWAEKAKLGYFAQDHSGRVRQPAPRALTDWISRPCARQGGYRGRRRPAITLIRGTLGRLLFGGDDVKKPVQRACPAANRAA
jgi:ATPase subunit of ABC transporter with duplicated ATPase domains